MSKHLGRVILSKTCGEFTVTEFLGFDKYKVRFNQTGTELIVQTNKINTRSIKDKYYPTVHGVGHIGDGVVSVNGKRKKEYTHWHSILKRCYNDKGEYPTYEDCDVSENFKSYVYFSDWCKNQVGFYEVGWELDKDLLLKGNKLYSEDTCCFVPREVNIFLAIFKSNKGDCPTGVTEQRGKYIACVSFKGKKVHKCGCDTPEDAFLFYKQLKEKYAKVLANKWKDKIDPRAYEALMNYQVEITD